MCLPAWAISVKIDGYNQGSLAENFSIGQSGEYDSLVVRPGDELRIPLTADLFTWSDGSSRLPNESIDSLFKLYHSRTKLSYKTLAGSDVLDYVQLEKGTFKGKPFYQYGTTNRTGKTVYISVKFIDDFADVKDKYFRYSIYLHIDGDRYEELSIELSGEYTFDVEYVTSQNTNMDLSDGMVIEAEETVPNFQVYLGHGVTVQKNLNKGERYYGLAFINDSVDDIREEWPELYPDVHIIYRIRHSNMESGISRATIKPPDGKQYYIYGDKMDFLGMTTEQVPFSEIYFLSTTEIPAFALEEYEGTLAKAPTTEQGG